MNDIVPQRLPRVVPPAGGGSIFASPQEFEFAQRIGRLFSEAKLVPEHLRGQLSDCVIAYGMAKRMGEDPLMVMQNIYFVHGRAGWNTQYMIARANRSGTFRGPLRWESKGADDHLAVTCFAYLAHVEEGDDPRVEITVDMQMAKADGWTRNDKYRSLPEQMLRWRSAAWLIRLYAPEVMMGYPITDELYDGDNSWAGPIDVTPAGPRPELRTYEEVKKPGPVIEGESKPAETDSAVKEPPKNAPPPAGTAAPAGNGAAATSTAPSPGPSSTGEPEKPKRQRRVLKANPEPKLPPDLEPVDEEEIDPGEGGDPPPGMVEPEPPPIAAYDVVVPEEASLQAWFKPAKDKLGEMHTEGRPPEDFVRFRKENAAMLKQMQEGFGFWAQSLYGLITRGEKP